MEIFKTIIYPIILSIVSFLSSYLLARHNNKNDLNKLKEVQKNDIEKLIKQHEIDLDALNKKFEHEKEILNIKHKQELELKDKELENKLKQQQDNFQNSLKNNIASDLIQGVLKKSKVNDKLSNMVLNSIDNLNKPNKG